MKSSCLRPLVALLLVAGLAACGGKASYNVSGTISGLKNNGLVLANGSDANVLTLAKSTTTPGTFTMPGLVADGSSYTINVATNPAGLACSIDTDPATGLSTGVGTMGEAAVTKVKVTCKPA